MENTINVNEVLFTEICKKGYLSTRDQFGKIDVYFTKQDIKNLCNGLEVEKVEFQPISKFKLTCESEKMNILKRSPVYYDLYEELNIPS